VAALSWYRKAADQGNASAQSALGSMYAFSRDYAAAASWYRKAADQGNAHAQSDLARCVLASNEVREEVLAWYCR
jgi:uncharacterized protein